MQGKTAFLVIRKLKYLTKETGEVLKIVEKELQELKVRTFIMSGVTKSTFLKESIYQQLTSPMSSVDEDISKAMIRANLGVVLFENGTVKGKWDLRDIPVGQLKTYFSE